MMARNFFVSSKRLSVRSLSAFAICSFNLAIASLLIDCECDKRK
jgi:hypothetical protein